MDKKNASNDLTSVAQAVQTVGGDIEVKVSKAKPKQVKVTATPIKVVKNNFNDLFLVDGVDMGLKPSAKVTKLKAIEKVLEEGDALVVEYVAFNTDLKERGKAVLDDLLTKIYAFALKIDASPDKDQIIKALSKRINDSTGSMKKVVTAKTPYMTVIVKYVVRTDRQSAHNYSRALRAAMEDQVAVGDLIAYFDGKGGIMKTTISGTQKSANAAEIKKADDLIEAMSDYLFYQAYLSGCALPDGASVTQLPVDKRKSTKDAYKEGASVKGTFGIYFTVYDSTADKYLVSQGFDFGGPLEEKLLRHICQRVKLSEEKFADIVASTKEKAMHAMQQMRGSRMPKPITKNEAVTPE